MSFYSSAFIAQYKTVLWLSPCVALSLKEPSGKATTKQSGVDGMAGDIHLNRWSTVVMSPEDIFPLPPEESKGNQKLVSW